MAVCQVSSSRGNSIIQILNSAQNNHWEASVRKPEESLGGSVG